MTNQQTTDDLLAYLQARDRRRRNVIAAVVMVLAAGIPIGLAVKGEIDQNNKRDRNTEDVSRALTCSFNPDFPGC